MSKEQFEAYIDFYGEDNIIAITFDNSSGKSFLPEGFTMENYYNSTLGCLQFIYWDIKGNPYHVIKPVENIQAIIVRNDGIDLADYDAINTLF